MLGTRLAVCFLLGCWRIKYELTFQTAAEKYGICHYPAESVGEICGQCEVVVELKLEMQKF